MENSEMQAILFEIGKWNPPRARYWMKKHNFRPIKRVHITKNYFRYRLRNPDKFSRFTTSSPKEASKKGIKFIIGYK